MAFTRDVDPKLHYILTPMRTRAEHAKSLTSDDTKAESHTPRVVLIHGLFFGNLAGWCPQITTRLSAYASTLCYDQRGHGLSAVPVSGYGVERQVDDLLELLSELNWLKQPLTLVGHSFGGRVALELALRASRHTAAFSIAGSTLSHSIHIQRVMLIDTPVTAEDDDATITALNTAYRAVTHTQEAHLSVASQALQGEGRRARKQLRRWRRLLDDTTLMDDLERSPLPTRDALSALRDSCELWGLYGGQSGARASRQALSELISSERWLTLNERGHFLLNEAPDEVGAWITHALCSTALPLKQSEIPWLI